MRLNAQRQVDKVRRHLAEAAGQQQGNTWTDSDLIDMLNEAQESLVQDVIGASEDFFGAKKDVDITAGEGTIDLWPGFLYLRLLEFKTGGASSSGDAVYQQATESRLMEGAFGSGGMAVESDGQYYYSLYGDQVHLNPVAQQTLVAGGQAWFIREPGVILLETIASAPSATQFVLSSGKAPVESDVMVDMLLDIVSGTGIGQRRKITAWDGPNLTATVSAAFSPALDSTSKIATVSRIPSLFHALLHMGAAIRAMADEKEDATMLVDLYNDLHEKLLDHVETRTYAQRGVQMFDLDE